jgi:hypothetical protein
MGDLGKPQATTCGENYTLYLLSMWYWRPGHRPYTSSTLNGGFTAHELRAGGHRTPSGPLAPSEGSGARLGGEEPFPTSVSMAEGAETNKVPQPLFVIVNRHAQMAKPKQKVCLTYSCMLDPVTVWRSQHTFSDMSGSIQMTFIAHVRNQI